jgi:hypothetical protein
VRRPPAKTTRAKIPPPPGVHDFVVAPELAAIILLELALDVAKDALLAEHPTLVDDFALAHDDSTALHLAYTICLRAASLRDTLRRYRRAVRDATTAASRDHADDDLPF